MSKDKSFQYSPEGQKLKNAQKWSNKGSKKKPKKNNKRHDVQAYWN